MTSKERQTTETVQAKKDKQQIQAKKDKQQKHKSWLLRLVETRRNLVQVPPLPFIGRPGLTRRRPSRELGARKSRGSNLNGNMCVSYFGSALSGQD